MIEPVTVEFHSSSGVQRLVLCYHLPAVHDVVVLDGVEYEVVRRRFVFTKHPLYPIPDTYGSPTPSYQIDLQPLEGK